MTKAAKRDPNKPKKAMTAFMFFSQANRPKVIEENPELKFGDVGRRLGELWKGLSPEERAPFDTKAELDKIRYAEEMKTYVPPPNVGRRSKKNRTRDMPKRAMSAYLYFCKEHRESVKAKYPELKMVAIQAKLGEMWKAATEEDKVPFQKQAHADRVRYESEVVQRAEQFQHTQAAPAENW